MKTNVRLIPALLLAGVLIFTGCEKDEDPMPPAEKNLVEVAQDAGQFSILIEAAQKAGLADFLATENNITVFAPTNAAFEALLTDLGASSLNDIPIDDLKQILTYHVVGSKAMSTDLNTGYYSTLSTYDGNPMSMYINLESGVSINKNVMVTAADIQSSNGIIHVVDKVILPPTVVGIALDNENFTTLVQAVFKAGLVDALNGGGPFTVFAPTNAAFDALFTQLGISGIDDLTVEQLVPILTYHVVSGNVLSTDLTTGEVGTLNEGNNISVDLSSGVKINNSNVIATNIQASNGVVHVIDAVLVPGAEQPNTIASIAAGNPDFSILVQALTKANLVEAVADESANLTVFAPTNAAFQALLTNLGASSLDDIPVDDLTQILLYHVIGSKAMSTDLSTGYYPTLASYSGNNISMYINTEGGVSINKNTMVTTADIEADNGVIHVVDKVILPPTVVDIALDNENFTTLVQAVVKAGLVDVLNGDGPFTIFAPTNAAFDALFAQLGISGIDDLTAEQLVPILTYHVVSGNVLSTDLTSGEVGTLNEGNNLIINLSSGVKINDSEVVAADIQGANGVVHVINKVLIP